MAVAVVLLQEIPVVGYYTGGWETGLQSKADGHLPSLGHHEDCPPHPPPHSFFFKILLSLFACHACFDILSDVVTKLKIAVFRFQALIDTDPYIVRGDRSSQFE